MTITSPQGLNPEIIIQLIVFVGITALIAIATWLHCRRHGTVTGNENKDYFLAGGGLTWPYIAGSITLTNLSTDQLVGMNGNQMLLLAWWELAAIAGLVILAYVFLPLYYKYQCTTTTELFEKKMGGKMLRALISMLFLVAGLFIYLPIMLYTGALFLKTMFGVDTPLLVIAAALAVVGAAYAIFGGLRAVAVSDTYSGVGLLGLCLLVVVLALNAIDWDFSGIPADRLTLIGDSQSPIPWHTLLTGMLFIQIFYWSFNQTITQRAMAAPSLAEARRGVMAAAAIRLLIIPLIVVVPGIVAYKLYGDIGDAAYGRIVGDVLPFWLSGAFAAMMAAAVLTSFNSALNSAAALYVCDIHERFFKPSPHVRQIAVGITIAIVGLAVAMVPVYAQASSIINLVQQLNGLLSMPILSAFLVAICFRNVAPLAAAISVIVGSLTYGAVSFQFQGLHYIHMMFLTLIGCTLFTLVLNRVAFGRTASLDLSDFRRSTRATAD